MLIDILCPNLLANLLQGKEVVRTGDATFRAGQDFLMPSHPLTHFEMQTTYQNYPNLMMFIQRNNLPQ